jgi:hypothetical protein
VELPLEGPEQKTAKQNFKIRFTIFDQFFSGQFLKLNFSNFKLNDVKFRIYYVLVVKVRSLT